MIALLWFAAACALVLAVVFVGEILCRPKPTPTTEAARLHPHPTRPPVHTGRHARGTSTWEDQS